MKVIYRLALTGGKQAKGFTLLELMITLLIVSVLMAVALPSFLHQVGKARETEIKNAVGTVNRAQQAYHWENLVFAQGGDDTESLSLLRIGINSKYLSSINIMGDFSHATIAPENINADKDQTRAYAGAIFVQAGMYSMVICQSIQPAANMSAPSSYNDCGVGEIIR